MSKNYLTRQTAAAKLGFTGPVSSPGHFTTKSGAVAMGSDESLLEDYASTDFIIDDDIVNKAAETILFSAALINTLNDDRGNAPVLNQNAVVSEQGAYFNTENWSCLKYHIGSILQSVNSFAVELKIYHTKNSVSHSHIFHFNTPQFWLWIWGKYTVNPPKQISFMGVPEGKPMVNNQWYGLRMTYNYTTHIMEAYINGVFIGQQTVTGSTADFRPADFELAIGESSWDCFKGYMKDVKIIDLGI